MSKVEPVAWLHTQGNFHEASMRELTDEEWARGWTQQPLYTAEAIRAEVLAERERCAKVCEAKHDIRARDGFPREASTARALAKEIRKEPT